MADDATTSGSSTEIDFSGFLRSDRFGNILKGCIFMFELLIVFFLGFNAAGWTTAQLHEYCIAFNNATCMNCAIHNAVNATGLLLG
jgi:hypothetical protein